MGLETDNKREGTGKSPFGEQLHITLSWFPNVMAMGCK
jgi:hypothetical protein